MMPREYDIALKSDLEPVLRTYNDDDDFVYGTLNRLETERQVIEMMRVIDYAEEHDTGVTQDELILLSIALHDGVGSCGHLDD